MNNLNDLINEREKLRDREKILTKAIKEERAKKAESKLKGRPVAREEHNKILEENRHLKGLIVMMARCDGKTYKEAGAIIGCGPDRAKSILDRTAMKLRFVWGELNREEDKGA